MCNCVAKVDRQLAKSNTCLDQCSLINMRTGNVRESLKIATRRADARNKRSRVKQVVPSYCPFCGKPVDRKYKEGARGPGVAPKEIRKEVARAWRGKQK
jgi:hypothetical protein